MLTSWGQISVMWIETSPINVIIRFGELGYHQLSYLSPDKWESGLTIKPWEILVRQWSLAHIGLVSTIWFHLRPRINYRTRDSEILWNAYMAPASNKTSTSTEFSLLISPIQATIPMLHSRKHGIEISLWMVQIRRSTQSVFSIGASEDSSSTWNLKSTWWFHQGYIDPNFIIAKSYVSLLDFRVEPSKKFFS